MPDIKAKDKAVAFVSDWRERSRQQQKKRLIIFLIASVVTFAICILAFFWFQARNYDRIVRQNMQYVQDSAVQEANQIEYKVKNGKIQVDNLAMQYSNLIRLNADMGVEDILKLLSDKNMFDRIAFIAPNGYDISLEGNADVSDRDYFLRGIHGNTGLEMIQKSRVTGKPAVVFYAPVYVGDEIIGVMAGFYEQIRLDEMFSYELFNYTPKTYLALGDGTVIANSMEQDLTGNFLTALAQKKFLGDVDFKDIEEAIADPERTVITFSYSDNDKTAVGVVVQFQDSDWMVLSILPYTITSGMVRNANRIGIILLLIIAATFLSLAVILIYFLRRESNRLEYEMTNATYSLEESLQEEEKQLSIIESMGGIYSSIYYINLVTQQYERIKENEQASLVIPAVGKAAEGLNLYIDTFISEEDQEAVREFLDVSTFRERVEKNGTEMMEYMRKDGGWRRGIITAAGSHEGDATVAIIFAVQKIDAAKEKELETKKALEEAYAAAQMANSAKTTFLSNMSHDIRTPMNAIIGMTAIAAANIDNTDKVTDCLNTITSSSKHLLGLINNVLDMSKIESGKVDLCEEDFSLSELIDSLISINQPLIKEKNHTLVVKVNNLKHEMVIGDRTRLQQVLTNFLSNSIKYTPNNGRLEVTLSEKETNKKSVGLYEVIFKDNGIGMTEEFVKTVFEPFARAEDSRISNIQGTGLGMSIAKNIINMMNGSIAVESKVNEGTTFTITFILKLQMEEDIHYEAFADLPILVVDDDQVACESVCEILNSLSMDSEWVTSGREAVKKTVEQHEKEDDYYAVIIDWKMPDMNGVETTREIRRQVGGDIPIIIISSYDWSDIEQEAREAGANAFLSKPLFKSKVVGLFNDLISGQHKTVNNVQEELHQRDFTGKRILLAEDNEINREIAVQILGMVGLEIDTAENGKVCVEKFALAKPGYYDLILMDIQMPFMNGYDATKAIRELKLPHAKKIPIIAMTANAFASDVKLALDAGMNGHISKPIDVKHMMEVLSTHLSEE